jgi:hypothetical protein
MVSYAIEPQINVDIGEPPEKRKISGKWDEKVSGLYPMTPLSPRGDALEFRACLLHNRHTIAGDGNHS